MQLSRRGALRVLAAGGAGVAGMCSGLGELLSPRSAYAGGWGDYPASDPGFIPPEKQAKNVLEVFLWGGISPWETFYSVDEEDYGKAERQMWWTFQDGPENLADIHALCQGPSAPPMLVDFTKDENGVMVKLGPLSEPIRARKDITDRLRLHVVSHDFLAHEVATPYALTGFRIGTPKLASVGAAVQHYHLTHGVQTSSEPYAYVIRPFGRKQNLLFAQAAAAGQHPAYARPFTLNIATGPTLVEALRRRNLGGKRTQSDDLLNYYAGDLKSSLTTTETGALLRSRGLDEYTYAVGGLSKADELLVVLEDHIPQLETASACGATGLVAETQPQLRLAAHLLTRPGNQVKHVTVVDQGISQSYGSFGYDSHAHHNLESAINLTHFWSELAAIINAPGENDPEKLSLDDTLIVINTEFGRSPGVQNAATLGRNHYCQAYVTAMFGGPIGKAQRGIVGSIGPDSLANNAIGPAETRAATLAALGIYPFAPECYAVSDLIGVATAEEGTRKLKETVLGLT